MKRLILLVSACAFGAVLSSTNAKAASLGQEEIRPIGYSTADSLQNAGAMIGGGMITGAQGASGGYSEEPIGREFFVSPTPRSACFLVVVFSIPSKWLMTGSRPGRYEIVYEPGRFQLTLSNGNTVQAKAIRVGLSAVGFARSRREWFSTAPAGTVTVSVAATVMPKDAKPPFKIRFDTRPPVQIPDKELHQCAGEIGTVTSDSITIKRKSGDVSVSIAPDAELAGRMKGKTLADCKEGDKATVFYTEEGGKNVAFFISTSSNQRPGKSKRR